MADKHTSDSNGTAQPKDVAQPNGTAQPKGTAEEAIGRPGPWGENRYEKKGQPLDQSVRTPPGTSPNDNKPVSTPVTQRDYVKSTGNEKAGENDAPGGDAG